MFDDRLNAEIRPAQVVDPRKIAARIDGVDDEETLTALSSRVVELLQRPQDITGSATKADRSGTTEHGIRVGLTGFTTDPQRGRDLEAAVQAVAADQLKGAPAAARRTERADFCGCWSDVPGRRLEIPSSVILWWDQNGAWVPEPNGFADYVIAVFMDPWCSAQLRVRDGSTFNPPVAKNEVVVGLANDTDWAKEIWADNLCSGRVASVHQEGTSSTYHRMRLACSHLLVRRRHDCVPQAGLLRDLARRCPHGTGPLLGGLRRHGHRLLLVYRLVRQPHLDHPAQRRR